MPRVKTHLISRGEKSSAATPYTKSERRLSKQKPRSKSCDPKQSHLYTDDNPSTTLHGTGFKDAQTAYRTIELVSHRSLTYQWQVINTMYYRAKGHPAMKKGENTDGMKAAMTIFEEWLKEIYPKIKEQRREEGRDFKPLLKRETVARYLTRIQSLKASSTSEGANGELENCKRFADMYISLGKGKRLANILLDDAHPERDDWEIKREKSLVALNSHRQQGNKDDLWNARGGASDFHLQCIGWAWSPVSEKKLPP